MHCVVDIGATQRPQTSALRFRCHTARSLPPVRMTKKFKFVTCNPMVIQCFQQRKAPCSTVKHIVIVSAGERSHCMYSETQRDLSRRSGCHGITLSRSLPPVRMTGIYVVGTGRTLHRRTSVLPLRCYAARSRPLIEIIEHGAMGDSAEHCDITMNIIVIVSAGERSHGKCHALR